MIKIYRFANRFEKWDFNKINNRLKKYINYAYYTTIS